MAGVVEAGEGWADSAAARAAKVAARAIHLEEEAAQVVAGSVAVEEDLEVAEVGAQEAGHATAPR